MLSPDAYMEPLQSYIQTLIWSTVDNAFGHSQAVEAVVH
jgi:hypothetical protein